MYQLELLKVSASEVFKKSLQLMEDFILEFNLQDYEGVFSMALHELFAEFKKKDCDIDIFYSIDNNRVMFNFVFSDIPYDKNILIDNFDENSAFILEKLTDELEYNIENKSVTILFHVKRKPQSNLNDINLKKIKIENVLKSI